MKSEFPKLPNYELVRRIGCGGFGEVYLSKTIDNEFVAVKVIPSKNAKREVEALKKYANLSNPKNLIKILDSGEIEGAIYYVMPLADTLESQSEFPPTDFRWQEKSLAKLIETKLESPKNEWFTRDEILVYILPIFDATIELGENGMLHRDIKPDNILFFNGNSTLSDFGLLERDRRSISNAGTPLYLAPSWYINKGGNPDAYGLATTFYTLITGNLPDAIGRPAYRFPEKIVDTISDSDKEQWLHWHRCIMRAIAENPTERFLTLQDFRNAIVSEDFTSSLNYSNSSEDSPKISNAKLYATLASLAAAVGGAFVFTSQSDVQDTVSLVQEAGIDEQIFKQIYSEGFSDSKIKFSIYPYSKWLKQKQSMMSDLKKEYAKTKKLLNKNKADIVAEVNKEYEKEFFEKFGSEYKNSPKSKIQKALNAYLKSQKSWIDNKVESNLNEVLDAPNMMQSLSESIAEINNQIENPNSYKQYVAEEYARYQVHNNFLKNKK